MVTDRNTTRVIPKLLMKKDRGKEQNATELVVMVSGYAAFGKLPPDG